MIKEQPMREQWRKVRLETSEQFLAFTYLESVPIAPYQNE